MSYSVIFTEAYEKRARKFFKRHTELISLYEKKLQLLALNPFHPSLRLHKLQGSLKELYSISINLQYRITLHFLIQNKEIVLISIGEHEAIYK